MDNQIIKAANKLCLSRTCTTKTGEFCGIRMRQSYTAVYVLETILSVLKPERIVEIGTWNGGLTAYFQTWKNINSGTDFLSVDIEDLRDDKIKEYTKTCFSQTDAFTPYFHSLLKDFIQEKRCLIYCDGGNKEKELTFFKDLVMPGSIIACHDYGTEVNPVKMKNLFQDQFTELLSKKQLKELKNIQQFWLRT